MENQVAGEYRFRTPQGDTCQFKIVTKKGALVSINGHGTLKTFLKKEMFDQYPKFPGSKQVFDLVVDQSIPETEYSIMYVPAEFSKFSKMFPQPWTNEYFVETCQTLAEWFNKINSSFLEKVPKGLLSEQMSWPFYLHEGNMIGNKCPRFCVHCASLAVVKGSPLPICEAFLDALLGEEMLKNYEGCIDHLIQQQPEFKEVYQFMKARVHQTWAEEFTAKAVDTEIPVDRFMEVPATVTFPTEELLEVTDASDKYRMTAEEVPASELPVEEYVQKVKGYWNDQFTARPSTTDPDLIVE
jgi:hypothetical protein